jgi:hypothetical protein
MGNFCMHSPQLLVNLGVFQIDDEIQTLKADVSSVPRGCRSGWAIRQNICGVGFEPQTHILTGKVQYNVLRGAGNRLMT